MKHNKPIWVAGLMSGTSLDGVDGAVILTDGVDILDFGPTFYRAYSDAERDTLRATLGKWQGDDGLESAANICLDAHAEVAGQLGQVDLIGFHGQTLAHDPQGRGTHQMGDGAALARVMGTPVVWDFRSNDVALGGQGAPLAPIYHHALVRNAGVIAPVGILNLGGVGNLTWVDPNAVPEAGLIAFDTGPANAPLNDFVFQRLGCSYDDDGTIASQGTPNQDVLLAFEGHPYFSKPIPKSLDRDDFARLVDAVSELDAQDGAATLTQAIVLSVQSGMQHLPDGCAQLWVTGGGRLNSTILRGLADALDCEVKRIEDVGFDGDMVEAQAFAYLAARVNYGLPTSFPKTTGVAMSVGGGVRSDPV